MGDHPTTILSLRAVEQLVRQGDEVLDVGCGPGRHAYELARRGITVHGIDISQRFVDLARDGAPDGATFERLDARDLQFDGEFDAAICLCQGAFGLMTAGGDDARVLSGIARALRPGGRLALSAFNAYFAVRHFDGTDGADGTAVSFDADTGVNHERTEVRDESGRPLTVDLWTGCYTPRELRLLCAASGLGARLWQLPVGLLLDMWGPRAVQSGMAATAVTSAGTRRSATCVVTWMTRSSRPIRSIA